MTKKFLVVLIALAVVLTGLGGLAPAPAAAKPAAVEVPGIAAANQAVFQRPGITVVTDGAGDLILINADPDHPDWQCTLPSEAPLQSPRWTDIKRASITQLCGGRVLLSIVLYGRVPKRPPVDWLSYGWQFEGGCVGGVPEVTDKDNVTVKWKEGKGWWAEWGVVTSCDPREVEAGDPVRFHIFRNRVSVIVQLDDLMLTVEPGTELPWHAGVRRLPFKHPVFTHTLTVDVAPDVIVINPDPPPPVIPGEDPAIWVPRGD